MRWSLFFIIQSITLYVTLSQAFPVSVLDLEARGRSPINVPSKTYRKASQSHSYAYKVNPKKETVSRVKISEKNRKTHGSKAILVPKTDADHILEKQLVTKHLAKHGPAGKTTLASLPAAAQEKLKKIVNNPNNLAPIPASINRRKGGKVKMGIQGKTNKGDKTTERYMAITLPTARKVAKQIDQVYKDHGIKTKQSVDKTLINTYRAAGILKKGQKPPPPSPPNSPKGKGKAAKK